MCSRLRVYTTARLRGCGILPGRVSARVHGAGPTPRVQDPACWSARDDARRHPKVLRGGGRGSARLVQGGGWVSSLMARWGCGAMALVVVMGVWGPWKRRMRPGGRVSQGGRDQRSVAGAQLVAVLARDHAPDPVEAVLNVPVVAGLGRDLLGAGLVHGQGADQVDDLGGLLLAAAALVGGAGASDPGSPGRPRGSPSTGGPGRP